MNIPKIRCQIFLDADDLNKVNSYGEEHQCRNISQAITGIVHEWTRFKRIALKLQVHQDKNRKLIEVKE